MRSKVPHLTQKKINAVKAKGGCCNNCGYDKCVQALDFHHLMPLKKEASWTVMRFWSATRIESELDKCVLLCANCHREVHAKIRAEEA